MPAHRLYLFIMSFVCGVLAQSVSTSLLRNFIVSFFITLAVIFLNKNEIKIYFICFIIFWSGFARSSWYEYTHRPLLDQWINITYQGKGTVLDEPEEKTYYQQVIVTVDNVSSKQKILLKVNRNGHIQYGDYISFGGRLVYPKNFKTDSGRMFPYQKYLQKDEIYYTIQSPHIVIIRHHAGNPLKAFLFSIKLSCIKHIEMILPHPESFLMEGMLIAGKKSLGTTLENSFKKVGLIHIVVLSGYNVTVVAEALVGMLFFIPQTYAYSCGAVGIVLFSLMAGGTTTIIRASAMSLIALFGRMTSNVYSALRALMLSGCVMIMLNPRILCYDPSFQLSFIATFGLIVLTPFLQKWFGSFGKTSLGEILASTLAVECCMLPYFLYTNGFFSLISLPANLLVLSFLPFTMLCGFLAMIFSYVSVFLAYPFAWIAFMLLRYILRIVEIATMFSFIALRI